MFRGVAPTVQGTDCKCPLKQEVTLMSVDTTVKKVSGRASPHGDMDQTYLISGKRVSLQLWRNEKPQTKPATKREYETVGYVLSGRAELTVEGQTIKLGAGDSWLVPAGAEHAYQILETFTALEATSPPAQVHGRDAP
jgi:quercetin dioxygenase-like cupin family protein